MKHYKGKEITVDNIDDITDEIMEESLERFKINFSKLSNQIETWHENIYLIEVIMKISKEIQQYVDIDLIYESYHNVECLKALFTLLESNLFTSLSSMKDRVNCMHKELNMPIPTISEDDKISWDRES